MNIVVVHLSLHDTTYESVVASLQVLVSVLWSCANQKMHQIKVNQGGSKQDVYTTFSQTISDDGHVPHTDFYTLIHILAQVISHNAF